MESPNISTPPQTDTPSKPEAISSIPSQTPKFSPRLIATFVLLLVIVGAFGFFLGKSFSKPSPAIPPIAKITPTPPPIGRHIQIINFRLSTHHLGPPKYTE